ncbi:condensation domain-containing protein [Nocardia sp. CDC159]|uniref:Condensation domain-containing protein n=1 Tax=Nocardia pulmonis TaxID=2951408 RepID=A0A9X2E9H2_9NOCA|nr:MULTISPECIES: condensation domain-containing protein [Nocardia]MCM6773983.1 condensation domain-containing protein [Nocardia pulmonis]MCM6786870.1 condensation domain-containing protein [Nocardia sp. CDC159]
MTGEPIPVEPTALQEAMWWLCQRVRDESVYAITWRLACDAAPDISALRVAWQAVVDRHEAMRLSFALRDGAIEAAVAPAAPVSVRSIEVDDPGSAGTDALLLAIAEELHRQPFDLARAPMGRLTLVRVGERYELILTVHHIALDGWAMQLLFSDLAEAYAAALRGAVPAFAAPAPSWAEFAREQARARRAGKWQKGIDHWRKTLDGVVATTVAGDRPRYAGAGGVGAILRHTFSDAAVEGVAALSKSASTTSFAVVLAAVQVLLARSGESSDVVVGALAANRMSTREQRLVGYTVNLCALRATVAEQDTLAEVTGRARQSLWQMLAHQGVPYPVVFSELTESARAGLGDIVPVMLNYLGPIGGGLKLGEIGMTLLPSPNIAARTDIAIAYWDTENGGITAEVEYSTARYDRDTVVRLLQDLDAVLALGVEPDRRVAEVPVRTKSVPAQVDHHVGVRPEQPVDAGAAAVDEAEQTVRDVWAELLGYPPASRDDNFFESGGHSLNAVEFVTALVEATGSPLDLATWLAEPTPRGILAQLEGARQATGAERQSTVVSLRPGAGLHLHLFAGAGGSVQDYRALIEALPADWRVTVSQEREAMEGIPAMAARFRADLEAEGLRPDLLGGWSMGGQLAFEVAIGLENAAPGIVLIDTIPPVGFDVEDEPLAQRLADFAETMCLALGVRLAGSSVVAGTAEDTLVVLSARLRAAGHEVSTAALAERWHTHDRHYRALSAYVSEHVLAAPATMLTAAVTDADAARWIGRFAEAPRIERVDADHYSVLRTPAVSTVARAIERFAELAVPVRTSTSG